MKLCTTLLLLTLLGVSNAAGVFSDYSIYNAFFQGPFTCQNSDVQGRLAAAGDISLTNYQVGCNSHLTSNPTFSDQCPQQGVWTCATLSTLFPGLPAAPFGLASGGNIQWTNGALYGGAASGSNANVPSLTGVSHFTDCSIIKASNPTNPVNFAAEATYMSTLSANVAALPATGTATLSSGTLTLTGSGATLEVFNVAGADISNTNTLIIAASIPTTTTIVINVDGASVTFSGGFDGKARSANILWNLFQATSINLNNYAFFGSLVAPNADFVNPAGVFWGQIFAKSFTSTSTCAQINFIPFGGNVPNGPPPPPQCGDGVVQPAEQCDLGTALNGADSSCCDANCKLKPTTTVCRPSAGECDVAESCDGVHAQCPADAFLPATTPCSSLFGICDLRLKYHCPGNGPSCEHLAPAPLWYWDAYNVLSFDSYTCHGGDVEGRLAARNHVDLSGFRLGEKTLPTDVPSFLALLVAGDATWTDGTVLPNTEYIGVGGVFTAPADLQARTIQPPAYITTGQFDAAFTYYVTIQQELAALETNVDAALVFTDGLQLTCNSATSDLYHVRVPASMISAANWYLTVGCKFGSGWILDITGSDDVTIKGAPFPGVVERVVYNVLGTGRTISANNGVAANILAPSNIYTQSGGVTYGRLICGNILQARQNNKPNCINFAATTLNNKILKAVNLGDTFVYLVDISSYVVGDLICFNSDCKKVVSGSVGDLDGDGVVDHVVNVDAPFTNNYPADMLISTPITNGNDRNPLTPTVITPPQSPTYANVKGSASTVVLSFFVLLAALLL